MWVRVTVRVRVRDRLDCVLNNVCSRTFEKFSPAETEIIKCCLCVHIFQLKCRSNVG